MTLSHLIGSTQFYAKNCLSVFTNFSILWSIWFIYLQTWNRPCIRFNNSTPYEHRKVFISCFLVSVCIACLPPSRSTEVVLTAARNYANPDLSYPLISSTPWSFSFQTSFLVAVPKVGSKPMLSKKSPQPYWMYLCVP